MSARALVVLLAIFAVLLAVVLWVDKPEKKEDDAKDLGSIVPKTLADVKAVEIEGKQAPIRVERDEGAGWRLVLPFGAEADPREVESFYTALTGVAVTKVVEEKGGDLATFGLVSPEGRVRIFPKDGSAPKEVQIGRASPVGDGRYAADGSGRILLLGGGVAGALDRSPESLRERRLFPVAADAVRKLTVDRGAGPVTLVRKDGALRLAAPVDDQTDESAADAFLHAAIDLPASDFPKPNAAEAAPPHFDGPKITLTVETVGEPAPRVVEIGSAAPDGKRWARRTAGDFVCLVDGASVSGLEREPPELRDPKLFAAETKDVRALLVQGGTGEAITAKRPGPAGEWTIARGDETVGAAAARAVDDLIDRMRWLRATSFDDPKVELRATRTLVFQGEGGDLGRIDFFEPRESPGDPGAPPRLYARSTWRPGITLGLKPEAVGALPAKASDLVAKPVDAQPADVLAVKVLLQRVSRASVRVDGSVVGAVGTGFLALVGVEKEDTEADASYLADKTAELRVFPDALGKMNRSVVEAEGGVLVVSQFTLAASTRRGRRPSFDSAAAPEIAEPLCRAFADRLAARGIAVQTGVFRAHMQVELVNDGPVTILLDPPPTKGAA